MPRTPPGFRAEMYPLKHKIKYKFGMSPAAADLNSTILTFIRNYKTVNAPSTIEVNPHNTNYNEDVGAICTKMSIIDNFKLSLRFNLTETGSGDGGRVYRFLWRPIFFSFPEKLDATDDATTTSVATILSLLKDATQEDVTPLYANAKFTPTTGASLQQPLSTVNLTETIAIANMDTDTSMETVAHDEDLFQNAKRRYTNKGALMSVVGRTRYGDVRVHRESVAYNIRGIPRAVRRIMPYSYFGILIHTPIFSDVGSVFYNVALSDNLAHIGVTAICTYDEWNSDHYQDMVGTG